MTRAERASCIITIELLRKLALNVHGVIDVIDNQNCDKIIEMLNNPEPQWIPWSSGKFPEESGTYAVTAYDGVTKRVTYAKYQKRLKRWELTGARAYWRVLAWKPLEEPWGGDADD
jgi:hypothetical protein